MEMELDDLEFNQFIDWAEVDNLCSIITPSMLNNPTNVPQQISVSSVQDSVGAEIVTTNQAQNIEHAYGLAEEAFSSIRERPQPVVDNHNHQLPQLPPVSFAPLLNETQPSYHSSSVVGQISVGAAAPPIQTQDMTTLNGVNQFSLLQTNNLNRMHGLDQHNEHSISHQLLGPNIIANRNFNGINHQPSSYPTLFQPNPVEAGAGIGMERTNTRHFMTNQRSSLFSINNQAINPHNRAWNSSRPLQVPNQRNEYNQLLDATSFQQQRSTLNGPTTLASNFTGSSALSSTILGPSGTRRTEGTISQVFSTAPNFAGLLRPERASGIQMQQMAPLSTNTITTQRGDMGHPRPSSLRVQTSSMPLLNLPNQINGRVTVTSPAPYSSLQQNPILNLQHGRGQDAPQRRGRPRKRYEAGEASSSSKRRKKGSSERGNAGKTPISGQANKGPENVVKKDKNANTTNPSSEFLNAMYDPAFESIGLPIDPHLRLLKAYPSEKRAEPSTTKS